MASNYGNILGVDPVTAAAAAATKRLEEENLKRQALFQKSLQALSPEARQGAVTGAAFGNLLGAIGNKQDIAALKGYAPTTDTSNTPEVQAAKQNLAFAKDIQGIKADPASSAWATEVAAKGKALGREDIAMQYLGLAAERRKAENALATKAAENKRDNLRSAVNALGDGGRAAWILQNPEDAKLMYDMNDKQYAKFAEQQQGILKGFVAKNEATMKKLNEGKSVDTTGQDVKAVTNVANSAGFTPDFFKTGWFHTDVKSKGGITGEAAQNGLMSWVAGIAKQENSDRARAGLEVGSLEQTSLELLNGLKDNHILTPGEPLDYFKMQQYASSRRDLYKAPSQGAADAGGAAKPPPPPMKHYDFSTP